MTVAVGERRAALERLNDELNDGELIQRLLAYAVEKAKRLYWQGMLGVPMPEGVETSDVVMEAVRKVIRGAKEGEGRGRRCWDGQGDLYDYVTSVIDSDLNHAAESWANRHLRTESVLIQDDDAPGPFDRDSGWPDPEQELIARDLERSSDEHFWSFYEFVEEDLKPILERIYCGDRKPSEMALALERPVEEIYNARKRLQRRHGEFTRQRRGQGRSEDD